MLDKCVDTEEYTVISSGVNLKVLLIPASQWPAHFRSQGNYWCKHAVGGDDGGIDFHYINKYVEALYYL